jgi:hypothetical protein
MDTLRRLAIVMMLGGCATTTNSGPSPQTGLVRFVVEPPDATLFVDDAYQGQVNAWLHQTLRLPTGPRRIELRAKGFMAQRFDIEVTSDEEVTLSLKMQPDWEDGDAEVPEEP